MFQLLEKKHHQDVNNICKKEMFSFYM